MRYTLTAVLVGYLVAAVAGQDLLYDVDENDRESRSSLRHNIRKLIAAVREFGDWEGHHEIMMEAIEKVYVRNGWDSEADAFSLDFVREVQAVPPWAPQQRLEKVMELIGDRYLLDERQEDLLRGTVIRESNEIFRRHSGRIMQYAYEAIQTRASGEAFTPEQVARWVKIGEPVFRESRQRMEAAAEEWMTHLDPNQQALLEADLHALTRRMDDVDEMKRRWARGEWEPSDWGMEEDPIQLAGEARATARGDRPTAAPHTRSGGRPEGSAAVHAGFAEAAVGNSADLARPSPNSDIQRRSGQRSRVTGPEDNDSWAQYVRAFIRKYALDDAQQARAWRIYRDLKTRADKTRKRYGERIASARRRLASAADDAARRRLRDVEARQKSALDRLFEQLKHRLERLPTRAQRQKAQEHLPERPVGTGKTPVEPVDTGGP